MTQYKNLEIQSDDLWAKKPIIDSLDMIGRLHNQNS